MMNWEAVIHMIVAFERQKINVCYVEFEVFLLNNEHDQIFYDELHISVMRWDFFVDQKICLDMLFFWIDWSEIAAL